jgi:single-strand DNA-binding protein
MTYSTATVEGFATKDAVLKKTKNGKSLCTFSIAIQHYSNSNAEPQVSFLDVETWEKTADFCNDVINKGKKILVIGTLKQDRWENADGKMRSKIKLIGKQVRLLEAKKPDSTNNTNAAQNNNSNSNQSIIM